MWSKRFSAIILHGTVKKTSGIASRSTTAIVPNSPGENTVEKTGKTTKKKRN
jgi:hypothetical protein